MGMINTLIFEMSRPWIVKISLGRFLVPRCAVKKNEVRMIVVFIQDTCFKPSIMVANKKKNPWSA